MSLIKYPEMSEFQKWLFFYLAIHEKAPKNMKGIIPKMCSGLKLKMDLENYDQEEIKFQKDAAILAENKLLADAIIRNPGDSWRLSEKGEIYILQKIVGPIIQAKDKAKSKEILDYFAQQDETSHAQIAIMLSTIKKENFLDSFQTLAVHAIKDFTPFVNALNKLHDTAKSFGLDSAAG